GHEILPVFTSALAETGRVVITRANPRALCLNLLPKVFVDDPEVGPVLDDPLGFRTHDPPPATGPWYPNPAGSVPDQATPIQLVHQDDANGAYVPAGPDAVSPGPVSLRLTGAWHAARV